MKKRYREALLLKLEDAQRTIEQCRAGQARATTALRAAGEEIRRLNELHSADPQGTIRQLLRLIRRIGGYSTAEDQQLIREARVAAGISAGGDGVH